MTRLLRKLCTGLVCFYVLFDLAGRLVDHLDRTSERRRAERPLPPLWKA